jgi:hypothetical protein
MREKIIVWTRQSALHLPQNCKRLNPAALGGVHNENGAVCKPDELVNN